MFIAMNRFRVRRGSEEAFENVWQNRDSYLHRVPGFVEFHLLKGPEAEDHTLYASHTVCRRSSAPHTRAPVTMLPGPSIWSTRNLKALKCVRR